MIERQNSGSGGGGEWMAPPEVNYSPSFVVFEQVFAKILIEAEVKHCPALFHNCHNPH